jgi:hypothetical protein
MEFFAFVCAKGGEILLLYSLFSHLAVHAYQAIHH